MKRRYSVLTGAILADTILADSEESKGSKGMSVSVSLSARTAAVKGELRRFVDVGGLGEDTADFKQTKQVMPTSARAPPDFAFSLWYSQPRKTRAQTQPMLQAWPNI